MFVIGIVDVTTVGSTICQRRLNELGGPEGKHPEFAVHSIPFVEYRQAVIDCDWDKVAELVQRSIAKLELLNVDFIIIPSNTPHYAYEKFAAFSKVPILNLIEVTADKCRDLKLKKFAILGTQATMSGGLYQGKLQEQGIELVVPPKHICDSVHHFIMDQIVPGKVDEQTRSCTLALIKSIDCDGYIFGCTELPEVYSSADVGKPAVDTTRLLAEVAFDIATHRLPLPSHLVSNAR